MNELNVDQALAMARPEIEALERLRQEVLKKRGKGRVMYYFTGLATLLTVVFGLAMSWDLRLVILLAFHVMTAGWLWVHFRYFGPRENRYASAYKTLFVSRMVELFVAGMKYTPEMGMGRESFCQSGLFGVEPDSYSSEDLFEGKVGATEIKFSEVHAQQQRTRQSSNGGSITYYETMFLGIFFVADFHKEFRSPLTVMPDIAEKHLGWIGKKLQKLGGDLQKMECAEFEEMFVVRGVDSVEARYILTPSMQEQLVQLRRRVGRELRVVFRDSKVCLAIPNSDNWFEGNLNKPPGDQEQTIHLLSQIKSCLVIVDELDLNSRIWSKE